MFVQVFQGRVSDPDKVKAQLDRWERELAPGAEGWLGSTSGVTDDGTFVALARFESEEAARRNSDRAEQGAWWEETSKLFTSEPVFHDSTEIDVEEQGDLDTAGFVQVMQGRTSDPAKARELMSADEPMWRDFRPDILGSLTANYGDGEWTMALYFTNEEEARKGEKKEPPPEIAAAMEQMDALTVGEPTFYDLRDPWLASP